MSRTFFAIATAGILISTALPAAAEGWRDRLAASVGEWAEWASPTATPPATAETAGLVDRAMALARSYAPTYPVIEAQAFRAADDWSYAAKQSMGCLITGTAGTLATVLGGGENLAAALAGGAVAPANAVAFYTGLVGVVFVSFCAIGQALTPLYLQFVEEPRPVVLFPLPQPRPSPLPAPGARVHAIAYP